MGRLDDLFDQVDEALNMNDLVIAEAMPKIPDETMQSAREHLAERLAAKKAKRQELTD